MKNDASCRTAQGNIILLTQNKYDLIYTIIRNSYNSMQSKNSIQEEISKQSKNSMQSKNRRSIKTRTACIAYYKVPQASVKKRLPGCFVSFVSICCLTMRTHYVDISHKIIFSLPVKIRRALSQKN